MLRGRTRSNQLVHISPDRFPCIGRLNLDFATTFATFISLFEGPQLAYCVEKLSCKTSDIATRVSMRDLRSG